MVTVQHSAVHIVWLVDCVTIAEGFDVINCVPLLIAVSKREIFLLFSIQEVLEAKKKEAKTHNQQTL